jgi:catechol 2,3-dioxygenase-like lactoylglutathione lyase family enzyme
MLNLGCTYLIVKDMEKSIAFYEALLGMKASSKNFHRWAQFNFGNCIALFNPKYDEEMIRQGVDLDVHYNEAYQAYKHNTHITYGNNFVLNFNVPDLNAEYARVKGLNIGEVSEILYINIVMPYYCFMLSDPDGNQIEIMGEWTLT